MEKKIRDLMKTELVKLEADRSVAEAAQAMRDQDVGDVLVMSGNEVAGILTDRDVTVRCIAGGKDPKKTKCGDIASTDLAKLAPDDTIDNAISLMAKKAIRRVPVLQDGRPVGIVSLGDLAQERDERSVLGAISAATPNH